MVIAGYVLGLRVFMVLMLSISVQSKLADTSSFVAGVRSYGLVPARLARPVAALIVATELSMLPTLVVAPSLAWPLLGGLMLLFGTAQASVLARRRSAGCHCFGARERLGIGSVLRTLWFSCLAVSALYIVPNGAPSSSVKDIAAVVAVVGLSAAVSVWLKALDDVRTLRAHRRGGQVRWSS